MCRGLCGGLAIVVLLGGGCGSSHTLAPGTADGSQKTLIQRAPGGHLTSAQRVALARSDALNVLRNVGLSGRIQVGAQTITIVIPAAHACTDTAAEQNEIVTQLKRALPFIRRVAVVVAGTGDSLASYLNNDCVHQTLTIKVL